MIDKDTLSKYAFFRPGTLSHKLSERALKIGRPVVFWSAIAFFYIYGDIHLNLIDVEDSSGVRTPWGVPIKNVTEEKFLIALALVQAYFFLQFSIALTVSLIAYNAERLKEKASSDFTVENNIRYNERSPDLEEQAHIVEDYHAKYMFQQKRLDFILKTVSIFSTTALPFFIPLCFGGYMFAKLTLMLTSITLF